MRSTAAASAAVGAAVWASAVWGAEPAAKAERPVIEAVFVLDTTGSMGGLLEGAKRRIWTIANKLAEGKPSPRIRVGLVAYRDKGDAYLTKVTPLTDDLDAVYADLLALQPGGGGDGPEDVKAGLHDAVTKLAWSDAPRTVKLIFLVGDAPGHLEYAETPKLEAILAAAVKKDIRVNAVRCGDWGETAEQWALIARLGEGRASSIPQDGGMAAVATHFDAELAAASGRVSGTLVAYGEKRAEAKGWLARADSLAAAAPVEASAGRALYAAKAGFGGGRDLLEALDEGAVKLESLKDDALPEELRSKTAAERRAWLDARRAEREKAKAKVLELTRKREQWIKANADRPSDGFEKEVLEAVRAQAKVKGIAY